MNFNIILCILLLALVSNTFADNTALSIWNQDASSISVGITDFDTRSNTPRRTLYGFSNVMTAGNQYSTYNYNTGIMYFVATSFDPSLSGYMFLKSFSTNTWTFGTYTSNMTTDTDLLSVVSAQTNADDDLFLIFGSPAAENGMTITKFNALTSTYTIVDNIAGYNFSSSAFDISNNILLIIMTDSNGNMIVNTYDPLGNKISSKPYTISNMNSSYKSTNRPYNLQYLPQLKGLYVNMNIYQFSWNQSPQMFSVNEQAQVFRLAPLISNSITVKSLYGMTAIGDYIYQSGQLSTTGSGNYAIQMDVVRNVYITSINLQTLPLNFWMMKSGSWSIG
ncbi:hypothetical protein PPL_10955 [Heterostelium album PN500]|uniref:Uncharacterized protein n=1 Tax=Heterostelium pallidum (strain ATCC 26659 / Pp 5 / PN500) TaxID=670386 RepID=D3BSI6_HETP5|nr:hypothetical protein PPL_10955 [Heterostelium album PN500]EFA75451.1 hypothetical protein PPL_10955 [Heterostelium album PN500]|eukprot:XP_020427585.1 hypothetical protein PPL_10955 [Heterostelium album PN500]